MIHPKIRVVSEPMDRLLQGNGAIVPFKVAVISQISSSAVSFLASAILVVFILRTEKRLSTPYRRITFGLCTANTIWSLIFLTAPFILPKGIPPFLENWGVGSNATCTISAFFLYLTNNVIPMYICLLCFYYLCKLKYHMSNEEFARRFERKAHIFMNLFNVVFYSVPLALDLYHPSAFRTNCMIAAAPLGCRILPHIVGECDATIASRVSTMLMLQHAMKGVFLVVMAGTMGVLYWHVISTNRLHSAQTTSDDNQNKSGMSSEESDDVVNVKDAGFHSNDAESDKSDDFESDKSDDFESDKSDDAENLDVLNETTGSQANLEYLSKLYRNETALQGILYISVYLISYVPTIVISLFIHTTGGCPVWLQLIPYIFLPGGFFFLFVYTRPQIAHLRRANPGLSRLRCFWLVLKAGGEVPEEPGDGISRHRDRLFRNKRQRKSHRKGLESISSLQIGAILDSSNGPLTGTAAPGRDGFQKGAGSSVQVLGSNKTSLQEGDLNYNPESQWSYVKGGSEVPKSSVDDSSEYDTLESIPIQSSIEVMDGNGASLQEGDLNYNPESQWSYVKGDSGPDTIVEDDDTRENSLVLESGLSLSKED